MEEEVPFIGDIFLPDRGVFEGTCIKGSLPVSDLNIQDNIFEIEVNLSSAINRRQLNERDAQVVIGVDVEIKGKDDPWRRGSVQSNVLKGIRETEGNDKSIRLKMYSSLLKTIGNKYSGIVEVCEKKPLQFKNYIVHSLKIVPGNYYEFACNLSESEPSQLKMSVNNVDFLNAMETLSGSIRKIWNSFQKIKFCVSRDDRNLINELYEDFSYAKAKFMSVVEDVVRDNTPKGLYERLVNVKLECQTMTEYVKDMTNKLREVVVKYRQKGRLIKLLLEDGIEYLGNSALDKYLKNDMNVFMLFISEGFEKKKIFRNINYLYNLMSDYPKKSIFLIIDLDASIVTDKIKIPKDSVIYHYKNYLISEDVQSDKEKKSDVGFVYFHAYQRITKQPEKRCVLNIPCPGSFSKMCSSQSIDWKCAKCKHLIEYGFDDRLYCDCGNYSVETCEFKCSDYRHTNPVQFKGMRLFYDVISDLTPMEEMNILLVGQTGVGKSTWINGIVNYLTFSSFEEAEKSDLIAVVPTQFTISTEDYEARSISVGKDANEVQKVGASATQNCKSYAFVTKGVIIRLIDTPGIGDTRGYEQDSENIIKIIQHIQTIKKLHGICFLLKPNETRLESCFNFCLKEIFCFLSKKARSNILFCFTNARQTLYEPKTRPLVEKLLEDANSRMHIFDDTCYCFDNESFKFLCAVKNGIKFSDKEKKSYADSWERSVVETYRLMSKVAKLEPYDASQTKDIADLRYKISNAIDSMHAINVNSETARITSLESQIRDCNKKMKDLENSKKVQETTLRHVAVSGDVVCTNASCTEKFNNDTIYKTRCCQGCTASTKYDVIRNVELLRCKTLSKLVCTICACRWEHHMITQKRQVTETTAKRDEGVQHEIDETKTLLLKYQLQLIKARREVGKEVAEKEKFASFASNVFRCLKKDTLVLHNDSLKDYLDYLIDSEESKPDKKGDEKAKIRKLNEFKNKHEEEAKIAEVIKKESRDEMPKISRQDVRDEEESLKKSEHYKNNPNKYAQTVIHLEKVIRCLK